MPSGAKRRKAAKKKKEKEADITPPTNNPQGSDDLKSQDEKGSDGGEGSSPAYHDHDDHHHHQFNEGSEEVEEGDRSVAHPSNSDIKPMPEVPGDITDAEVVGGQEFNVVKTESDLKYGEHSDQVNESVENVRSFEESHDGHGNFIGTASDGFLNETNSKDDLYNSKQKEVTSEGLTYPDDSRAVVGGHKVIVKIDSGLKSENSSGRIGDSVADVNYTSELVGKQEVSPVKIVSDLESSDRINERVDHAESAKESLYGNGNSSVTSNVGSLNENNSKDEPNNSKQMAIISGASAYPVDDSSPTKTSLTSENTAVKETSNLVVEPCVNSVKEMACLSEVKNSDNGSALQWELTVSQVAAVDLATKRHEDKVSPLPDQHVTTPALVESLPTDNGSKVSGSVFENPTPIPESTKDAVHAKGSETPECSENKAQVVSAPHMAQKTSWLSCCGLFEVLSGSNR